MLRRELVFVDTDYEGTIDILVSGRRDDDLLCTAGDVRARPGLRREQAGAFQDDVDAERGPRQLGRIALGQHLDSVTFAIA